MECDGQEKCKECSPGIFSIQEGVMSTICPPNTYSKTGRIECTLCSSHTNSFAGAKCCTLGIHIHSWYFLVSMQGQR